MDWVSILTALGVRVDLVSKWAPVFERMCVPAAFSLGFAEIDDFMGQILHESGKLSLVEENLNYTTAARICAVWPKRFPTECDALPFVRKPVDLANRVYGGRMGNVTLGDGFKYRGRGLIMVTGRENYRAVGHVIGLDLEESPDMMGQPGIALLSAIAWWEGHVSDAIMGDVKKVTRAVNGGLVGLDDRIALTEQAQGLV